jgi:hypothetical protein
MLDAFDSEATYPPFSQIPHGSASRSPALAVRDPFSRSNPQKKSVSFGNPGRSTAMLPAQFLPTSNVTFGSACVTWKSIHIIGQSDLAPQRSKGDYAHFCHSGLYAPEGMPV